MQLQPFPLRTFCIYESLLTFDGFLYPICQTAVEVFKVTAQRGSEVLYVANHAYAQKPYVSRFPPHKLVFIET